MKKSALLLPFFWLISALIIHRVLFIPDDALRLTIVVVPLYGFPGYLTARTLRLGKYWKRVPFWAIAIGIGLTEALVLGQVAVMLGLPTQVLADAILFLAALKIIWLVRRNFTASAPSLDQHSALPLSERWGLAVQIALVVLALIFIIFNFRQIPVYTWSPSDSWHYTQVQVQFSDNPGHMNVQEGITAPGTNRRLLWNSWLYNRAMLVDVAAADPIVAQQRDGLYALVLFTVIVYVALGQELFEDAQTSWLAAFLQLGIVILAEAEFVLRMPEDKFFSFYAFIPLVYMLVIRLVRGFNRRDFGLFIFLTIGMALIHPFNPIALFLTVIPFILLRWLVVREKALILKTLPIAVWIALLLIYPLLTQRTLIEDPLVAGGIATSQTVDWGYHLTETWGYAAHQIDYLAAIALLPALAIAVLRSKQDLVAQFLFAVSAAIIVLLWIPPFAALGALVMTQTQNWRIFMLIPVGFGWAWLLLRLWQWFWPRLQKRRLPESAGRILWGGGTVLVLALLWRWPSQLNGIVFLDTPQVSPALHTAFDVNRSLIANSRVLTTEQWSLLLPTLWPDATLAFWRNGFFQQDALRDLTAVMNADKAVDPAKVLTDYGIQYLLLPHTTPLVQAINTTWPCCVNRYENDELSLFEFRYPISNAPLQPDEIITPTDFRIGDFAQVKGYTLTEQSGVLFVTLYWLPLQQTSTPYTAFVHLLGDTNPATGTPLWAQDDHPPRLGQTPTTSWQVGDLIRDMYRLDLTGLTDGTYTISLGMYDSTSVTRVPISDSHDKALGDELSLATWTYPPSGH